VTDTELALIEAGWRSTRSGRWYHEAMPTEHGRRRLYTTHDAATLLQASRDIADAETERQEA
jgi:negative regulator of replication initiation